MEQCASNKGVYAVADFVAAAVGSMIKKIIIFFLRLYKLFISPVLGSHCRFTPTCSAYAIHAFEKYTLLKACGMVISRLLKCHPFHPGGFDPI